MTGVREEYIEYLKAKNKGGGHYFLLTLHVHEEKLGKDGGDAQKNMLPSCFCGEGAASSSLWSCHE